jgi:hypothetical protein
VGNHIQKPLKTLTIPLPMRVWKGGIQYSVKIKVEIEVERVRIRGVRG